MSEENIIRFAALLSDAAEGLRRIPLLKLGTFVKVQSGKKIKFSVTPATVASVVKNFRDRGGADVVVDYDHASSAPSGEGTPAAGWLKAMDDAADADGILWGSAELTERARGMVAAKELRYVSPELHFNGVHKTTGNETGPQIPAVSLTNRPFLEGLPAIALSDGEWTEINRGDAGDEREKKTVKVILTDRVARTVRLVNDDGSEGAVLQVEGLEAVPQVVRLSDLTAGTDGRYNFAAVSCGDGVLIAGEVFRAQLAQKALDEAIAAGKILPAQRKFYGVLALNDLAAFDAFVKDAPKVVDLTERGTSAETLQMADLDQVDAEIHRLTKAKQATMPKADYATACKLVLSENPALAERKKGLSR